MISDHIKPQHPVGNVCVYNYCEEEITSQLVYQGSVCVCEAEITSQLVY